MGNLIEDNNNGDEYVEDKRRHLLVPICSIKDLLLINIFMLLQPITLIKHVNAVEI